MQYGDLCELETEEGKVWEDRLGGVRHAGQVLLF